jgi:lipid-binding SYLF domain-containing protein
MPFAIRVLSCLLAVVPLAGFAADPELVRAENAVRVLNEVMQAPDKAIPRDLLRDAHAIAVVPDVLKVGFVIGGRRGEGLMSVKSRDGTWSNPSFVNLTGGSVGFQAGVSSTDVILVFRTQRGVDSIVGRTAQAATDAQLKAEIFSYSRARGLFAGVALDGTVLSIGNDSNQLIFGEGVTPRRIFEGGISNVPAQIIDFRDRLEEYTAQ